MTEYKAKLYNGTCVNGDLQKIKFELINAILHDTRDALYNCKDLRYLHDYANDIDDVLTLYNENNDVSEEIMTGMCKALVKIEYLKWETDND